MVVKNPKNKMEVAVKLGRMGGEANVKKHGKAHMKKISKLGAKARKINIKRKKQHGRS